MSKLVVFDEEAREKISSGSRKLAKIVAKTMGPRGKNVLYSRFIGNPCITKDGVSVARELVLKDPFENQACQLIKEAAGRTADIAGDGTTTATVLSNAIVEEGFKLLKTDVSPIDIREGLQYGLKISKEFIVENSKVVSGYEDTKNIASISANNDYEIGGLIADAYEYAGLSGTVSAEANSTKDSHVRFVDGLEILSGLKDSRFLSKGSKNVILENARILCVNREMTHFDDCIGLFTKIHETNTPVLVLARDITKTALETLVANNNLGKLKVCAVKIPQALLEEQFFEDFCSVLGTNYSVSENLSTTEIEDLGFAKKIEVGPHVTKVFETDKNDDYISEKVRIYEDALKDSISDASRDKLLDKLRFLKSKGAIVSVSYSTELELREKGDRIEDAMWATRAALEEGIVAGGGVALLRCSEMLRRQNHDKHQNVLNMLSDACSRPFYQICENASKDPLNVKTHVLEKDDSYFGYNARTDSFENLYDTGVIDPVKVTITALSNAVSIGLQLINTEAMMVDDPEEPSDWQPPTTFRVKESGKVSHHY